MKRRVMWTAHMDNGNIYSSKKVYIYILINFVFESILKIFISYSPFSFACNAHFSSGSQSVSLNAILKHDYGQLPILQIPVLWKKALVSWVFDLYVCL